MAGRFKEAFEINGPVSEGFFGLVARVVVFFGEGHRVVRRAHPFAAATGHGFDNDRIADFFGDFERLLFVVDGAIAARNDGDLRFDRHFTGFGLIAKIDDRFLARADELDVTLCALLGEIGVFREETVAGVDRIHIGDLRGRDDAVGLQVA